MLTDLIKNDTVLRNTLLELELTKTRIELEEIDFSSKESMTKLSALLSKNNSEYGDTITNIERTKVDIELNYRKLNVTRELINAGLLKEFEQIDRFIKSI